MSAPLDSDLLAQAAEWLAQRAGFHFNLDQSTALWNALGQRARALHLADRRAYLQHLHLEANEWMRLAEEITVHETAFFRHAGQFRVLSEIVLPELVRLRAAQRKLRLWSAACATGEEPYSLAIAIRQLNLPADWQVEIIATDLSTRVIEIAEEAVFDKRRLRTLAPDLVARMFEPTGERFRLRDDIRSLVTFSQFNLTQTTPLPEPLRQMDIVFCENVLIYFQAEAVRRVVGHLREALLEGGYLFLGFAETLHGMSEGFSTESFGDAYIYRRVNTTALTPMRPREHTAARRTVASTQHSRTAHVRTAPAAPVLTTVTLSQVEALIDSRDWANATHLAEQWVALEPDSIQARFILARLYATQDRDAEAADLVRQLLLQEPLHARSYVLLGILCYRQGEMEEALAQFQHALYLEPNTPVAYFFLGNIYQQRGQLPHAIHAYRNAMRMALHAVPAWDNGFTPELLIQTCERSIARLEKSVS